jgi:hypothetical protein
VTCAKAAAKRNQIVVYVLRSRAIGAGNPLLPSAVRICGKRNPKKNALNWAALPPRQSGRMDTRGSGEGFGESAATESKRKPKRRCSPHSKFKVQRAFAAMAFFSARERAEAPGHRPTAITVKNGLKRVPLRDMVCQ